MATDILIHKNSYTKIQSTLTYGYIKCSDTYSNRILNCHNRIYDLYHAFKPKNILLQIEEYSNEFHHFVHDKSIATNVLLSIDNNYTNFNSYTQILQQIKNDKLKAIAPKSFVDLLKSQNIQTQNIIEYNNLYNQYIFNKKDSIRNNKILCILSTDSSCISSIEKYLYPKSDLPIVMVNNPEIKHDQNIGLLFDNDMCEALNNFGSVIDFTLSYDAEINICGIPKYSLTDLEDLPSATPVLVDVVKEEAEDFIRKKL